LPTRITALPATGYSIFNGRMAHPWERSWPAGGPSARARPVLWRRGKATLRYSVVLVLFSAGPRSVASVTEDPANRRIHGGRASRFTFQLVPLARPEFVRSANSPNVFHSDFSPVTASNPARRGEVLICAVTGLGPTLPGKQPGALFPADSLQEIASPIQVLVNGTAVNASNQMDGLARPERIASTFECRTTPPPEWPQCS
jgi:hypothetical protein